MFIIYQVVKLLCIYTVYWHVPYSIMPTYQNRSTLA